MKEHQLILRFVLELMVLGLYGFMGAEWEVSPVLGAIGLPVLVLLGWGLFTVPDDPSRGKANGVHIKGWMRLVLEGLVFGGAFAGSVLTYPVVSTIFGLAVVYHYATTKNRIVWLLKQK
ncbi:MAG: hypothetical protein SchgKO_00330 [Schleiferiaceae bacterium]